MVYVGAVMNVETMVHTGTGNMLNRFERDIFRNGLRGKGLLLCGFEVAVDSHINVLIETGVPLHARFGLGSAFENTEIMLEETDVPLDGGIGMVVLQSMGTALSFFDEFAVRHTSSRPGLGEMVGIELEDVSTAGVTADNNVFFVTATFSDGVHGATEVFDCSSRHKIAHSPGMGSGNIRIRCVRRNNVSQTVFNDRF